MSSDGNPKLRAMSPLQVRERLKETFVKHPDLRARYNEWARRYEDGLRTYGADYRGVLKGARRQPTD